MVCRSLLLALIYVFTLNSCKGAGCHHGWVAYTDKCYMFSHMAEPWPTASSYCHSYQGKLAEPITPGEQSFLASHASSQKHLYWIGISDVIVENQWIYSSTQHSLVVNNWRHGQPDGHSGENCVLMDGHSHGQWRDTHCHVSERFVCEMSLEESSFASPIAIIG
ncbi:C-type lectin domain family 10 member A [Magallana gigas]|uniref:C-type lectin domain family 10 member A n=1 Tax=Magallana gigas TaxID=29159 RepID=UPI00333F08AB